MADLEKRVATLEQELDVLKAEIQTTLLDIQEQVLTNAYPLLRSNDGNREHQSVPPQQMAPVQSISLNSLTDKPQSESKQKSSIIRMVNVNEPANRQAETKPDANRPRESEKQDPLLQFSRYEEWVSKKVDQLGVEKTKKLIRLYAKQGHLTIPTAKRLMEFMKLYIDDQPVQSSKKASRSQGQPEKSEKSEEKGLIVRLIAGLSSSNSSGARKHG